MADTGILEQVKTTKRLDEPKMFQVILHNDDTTTFDFVIKVLTTIFHRTLEEAVALTTEIHHKGQCVAGSPYTREVAEAKAQRQHQQDRARDLAADGAFLAFLCRALAAGGRARDAR